MDDIRITEEAKRIKEFIDLTWGKHFQTKLEKRLSNLFPEPENVGLKHIWRHGSADIVVYKHGNLIAIIEPGGGHHFKEKQSLNDRRKWKLAEINGVRCVGIMNGVMQRLSKRQWRSLIGSHLFPHNRSPYSPHRKQGIGMVSTGTDSNPDSLR